MEKPEYVYWMPTNEPSFVLPYQHQFQQATVIKAIKGQKLDQDLYFSLLADRIQFLIDVCFDPEDMMFYTFNVLEGSNLISIYEKTSTVKNAGRNFVFDNHLLREHLYLAGVFKAMPKQLNENDLEADELYNATDIESWFSAVTTTLPEDYR